MLIRVADEMGFKITTFQHVLEGYKVAKEIAAHNAGASTFSDWWGYKMEAADAIPHNAALMTHKGVLVSINSDDAEQARRLNMEAAKADPLRRRHRRSGVRDGDDQSGEAAQDRQPRRLDRSRQGRRPGRSGTTIRSRTAAIVERTYIDGIAYYDREKDLQRITDIQKEKGGRSTTEASPAATNGIAAAFARPRRRSSSFDVKANADGPTWAITNARIVTVSGPVIAKGIDRHQGQPHRSSWRERNAPARRQACGRPGARR